MSHSEEGTRRYQGRVHGVQLWVAQPSTTRDHGSAFEHHAELPRVELPSTERERSSSATSQAPHHRPAATPSTRASTSNCGPEPACCRDRPDDGRGARRPHRKRSRRRHHRRARPPRLSRRGPRRLEVVAEDSTRVLLIGGVPFDEELLPHVVELRRPHPRGVLTAARRTGWPLPSATGTLRPPYLASRSARHPGPDDDRTRSHVDAGGFRRPRQPYEHARATLRRRRHHPHARAATRAARCR